MSEEQVKQTVLKIHGFDEFPYGRMKQVLDAVEALGFDIKLVDNGNIVCVDTR